MHSIITAALAALATITTVSGAPAAAPAPVPQTSSTPSTSGYWLGQDSFHTGSNGVWGNPGYKLFRDVRQYGAVGDGSTDDTAAIQKALNDGGSCGDNCNSSSIFQKIVYVPAGVYIVSSAIEMPYYTQLIGDATDFPTIKGSADFQGIALIDADPYIYGGDRNGQNWFINTNNFFRQVRNFKLDVTGLSAQTGACIHWQVAQATSLQNIEFHMKQGTDSQQQGIFMDNGSGGFMSDLTFYGGLYGAFLGNQQFTSRNLTFINCQTAIFMNWNWGWTLSDITIQGPGGNATGINMAISPSNQTVGSVVLADSTISGVQRGVISAYKKSGNVPESGGSLIIDNVNFQDAPGGAVVDLNDVTILNGGQTVKQWVSGNVYDHSDQGVATQGALTIPTKSSSLLSNGKVFGRSKPQYENVPASQFSLISAAGCKGDGATDVTQCMQTFLNDAAANNSIAYFDHGVYRVTDTVTVPSGSRIVGECWSTILATNFTDASNPKPVWQLGKPGDSGTFEISDILWMNQGPNPGAIMVQWNMNCKNQGDCGMWDSHVRIGGSYGTNQDLSNCAKQPLTNPTGAAITACTGVHNMFYAPSQAMGVYLENTWFWVADHDFEDQLNRQISLFSARGVLIKAPVSWLWGTSSEHSAVYNYQFDGVQALFAGFIQTETPYMQPYPLAPAPFTANTAQPWRDPDFSICSGSSTDTPCKDAWGLRMIDSKNVVIYSLGMYSFFNGYSQDCILGHNCQENMIRIQNSQATMYAVSTIATVNMIRDNTPSGQVYSIKSEGNRDVYTDTIAAYLTG